MASITHIKRPSDHNRLGDVVFMHGLNGDAHTSWTNAAGEFWPEWLAEDVPNVGVVSVGYELPASAWSGSAMPLFDQAPNVLALLDTEGIGEKPICFISHSMGGLLVKKMLQIADSMGAEFRRISEQTRGVVFLATPHTGSDVATLTRYLNLLLRRSAAVRELENRAPALRELNVWYRENADRIGIATQVYFETKNTNGVRIVSEVSADPGLRGVLPIAIEADHRTISKPVSKETLLYKRIRKFVRALFLDALTPAAGTNNGIDLVLRHKNYEG